MAETRNGIPPEAHLVFKGVIFEVWQWEQKMFDGSTETFERLWRPPTVGVIGTIGDKIIIEEQDQPDQKNYINLPEGRADQGDDMLAEAKRELLEETGYSSEKWSSFVQYGGRGKVIHEEYVFLARECTKKAEPHLDAGEKIAVKLLSFEEFLALADEPRFSTSSDFRIMLLRAKNDPAAREELRKKIFG